VGTRKKLPEKRIGKNSIRYKVLGNKVQEKNMSKKNNREK